MFINRELLEVRAKFRDFYNNTLWADYKELEKIRRKYMFVFIILLGVSLFIISKLYKFFYIDGILGEYEKKILTLIVLGLLFVVMLPIKKFKVKTKDAVMDKILSFFGDMKRVPNTISRLDIKASDLINVYYDRIIEDDSFEGSYKGVNIKVSEKKFTKHYKRRERTVFNGLLVMLDFNKYFHGKTSCHIKNNFLSNYKSNMLTLTGLILVILSFFIQMKHDNGDFITLLFNAGVFIALFLVAIYMKRIFIDRDKSRVNLEDVLFSKKWDVYATDQIESRYILTPKLMQNILILQKRFKGKNIEFSFFDNKLFIAIHTRKNMFETTSFFRSALSFHRVQNVIYQFYSIFSIIDLLELKNGGRNEKNRNFY